MKRSDSRQGIPLGRKNQLPHWFISVSPVSSYSPTLHPLASNGLISKHHIMEYIQIKMN